MGDERIEDLEVRLSFLEADLRALDGVVRDTAELVGRLTEELRALREQYGTDGMVKADLGADEPPHHAKFRG